MKTFLSLILMVVGLCEVSQARPEYAAKQILNCTMCHLNPWGGGPKTVYGKFYGSRGYDPGKFSNQETFAASLRGIAYYPNTPSQTANGFALMEASASANVVAIESKPGTAEVRAVGTYNASPLGPGPREVYVRVMAPQPKLLPIYFTVGRFNAPFGLMTDEHRTYTRMQTNTTINDFFTGGAMSGNLFPEVSFDLALVNDLQGSGNFTTHDVSYATIGNLRWISGDLPLLLGISQNFQYSQMRPEPYATSFYGVLSVDRWTGGKVPASFLMEAVTARNFNNPQNNGQVGGFFIPSSDATYQTALAPTQSLGIYSMLRYDLTQHFTFFYKFDSLTLDTTYAGDVFLRNGLGFEITLNSNTYINVRFEKAYVSRPEIATSGALAAQDDVFAMMRFWL